MLQNNQGLLFVVQLPFFISMTMIKPHYHIFLRSSDLSTHTLSSLSRHRRGHSASKPYECGECGQRYADKKRLRDHQLGRHSGQEPQHQCSHCKFRCRR